MKNGHLARCLLKVVFFASLAEDDTKQFGSASADLETLGLAKVRGFPFSGQSCCMSIDPCLVINGEADGSRIGISWGDSSGASS